YSRLRQQWPDAPRLVLAGRRGWLFDDSLRRVAELGLTPHIDVLTELPEADLPALYRGAGLFVLLSHYEGFGFTLLEALGWGVPAVISNRASLPEIAGDAAILVNPDDLEAAADGLYRALSDSTLRADLITRGLAQAARFTWERTARATLELYGTVLHGGE